MCIVTYTPKDKSQEVKLVYIPSYSCVCASRNNADSLMAHRVFCLCSWTSNRVNIFLILITPRLYVTHHALTHITFDPNDLPQ